MLTGIWHYSTWSQLWAREMPDGTVWWFEYSEGLRRSRVFRGRRERFGVSGTWMAVPLTEDRAAGVSQARLELGDGAMILDGNRYTKHVDGFPSPVPAAPAWTSLLSAVYVGQPGLNMTGTYQRGDTGDLFWVGEQVRLRLGGPDPWVAWVAFGTGSSFLQVFAGTRRSGEVAGEFVDLPGAASRSAGSITDAHFVASRSLGVPTEARAEVAFTRPNPADPAGRRLFQTRFERVRTTVVFETFTVDWPDEGDRDDNDEPYVWLAAGTFDGISAGNLADTVVPLLPDGTRRPRGITALRHTGMAHGNLRRAVSPPLGVPVPVPPDIGVFQVDIESLRGVDPSSHEGRQMSRMAVIAVGLEADNVRDDLLALVEDQLPTDLQRDLDGQIVAAIRTARETLTPPDPDALASLLSDLFSDEKIRDRVIRIFVRHFGSTLDVGVVQAAVDPDDVIGSDAVHLTLRDLHPDDDGEGREHPFTMRLTRDVRRRPIYRLTGVVRVHDGLKPIFRRAGGYRFSRLEGYVSFSPVRDLPMLRLCRWQSDARQDSFTTSDPQYTTGGDSHSPRTRIDPDYELRSRAEPGVLGLLFDPRHAQPPGTVPLRSWWSPRRLDNLTTTQPSFSDSDYRAISAWPVEGFIYDPARPQPPGTWPLVRWESRDRNDNITTTELRWIPETDAAVRIDVSP